MGCFVCVIIYLVKYLIYFGCIRNKIFIGIDVSMEFTNDDASFISFLKVIQLAL